MAISGPLRSSERGDGGVALGYCRVSFRQRGVAPPERVGERRRELAQGLAHATIGHRWLRHLQGRCRRARRPRAPRLAVGRLGGEPDHPAVLALDAHRRPRGGIHYIQSRGVGLPGQSRGFSQNASGDEARVRTIAALSDPGEHDCNELNNQRGRAGAPGRQEWAIVYKVPGTGLNAARAARGR